MSESSPLDELIVDEEQVDEEQLARALRPHIKFTRDGRLIFDKGFEELTTLRRVCAVLLALRAMHLRNLRDRPGATNAEIIEMTGMPTGTVNPRLGELKDKRLAIKKEGDWVIPDYALHRAAELVAEGGG